jgi:hypothetical protein
LIGRRRELQVEGFSALTKEITLRERLSEIIPPRRKVRVRIRFDISTPPIHQYPTEPPKNTQIHSLINIRSRREPRRVASNINLILPLVHPNIVHIHVYREREVSKVDVTEIVGHAQVDYDVLYTFILYEKLLVESNLKGNGREGPTIGSCETGLADICTVGSAAMPSEFNVHEILLSDIHVIYY